jgi:hypothetical protein
VGTSSSLVAGGRVGSGVGWVWTSLGVKGLRVRTGGEGSLETCCWSLLTGRNLLLGNPEAVVSKSLLSSFPMDEKGIRLAGGEDPRLPDKFVARGSSEGSLLLSGLGLRALFPVGTILNRVRVRVFDPPVPDGPVADGGEKRPLLLLNSFPFPLDSWPGPVGTSWKLFTSSRGVLPLIAKGFPGKSSGTIGRPLTLEITGGGVASCWGINSTGVKFSVRKGRFVGLTRTTLTPVGPNLVSESGGGPLPPPVPGSRGSLVTGCLARGLVTSIFGSSWIRVGSVLPIVPTGRIRTRAPLMASSLILLCC